MSLLRSGILLLAGLLWLAGAASAQIQTSDPAELSLKDGKTDFRAGEPIVLDWKVLDSAGPEAHKVTYIAASAFGAEGPEQITLTREAGGAPWRNDFSRWVQASPHVYQAVPSQAGLQWHRRLLLSEEYRFDQAGRYTVQAATRQADGSLMPTNTVSFNVEALAPEAEARRALELANELRDAREPCEDAAALHALSWLPGDEAAKVKVDLLLASARGGASRCLDLARGLWFSRNRALVVEALEKAALDPARVLAQPYSWPSHVITSWQAAVSQDALVFHWVLLKSSLLAQGKPPNAEADRALVQQVVAATMHQIATTLPQRSGRSLQMASWMVLNSFREDPSAPDKPDFLAARDIVARHLDDLSGFQLTRLQVGFDHAFDEADVTASVQRYLQAHPDDIDTLHYLVAKQPSVAGPYVVRQVCKGGGMYFDQIRGLPVATLPAVDECLRERLAGEAQDTDTNSGQIRLGGTLAFVARFATASLMPDVIELLPKLHGDFLPNARAAALVYLMRWDPQTYSPKFEAAMGTSSPGNALDFTAGRTAHVPADGVRAIYLKRFETGSPDEAVRAVQVLAEIGAPQDHALISARLQSLRDTLRANPSTSNDVGTLESVLTFAVLNEGDKSAEQRKALVAGCASARCKREFRVP